MKKFISESSTEAMSTGCEKVTVVVCFRIAAAGCPFQVFEALNNSSVLLKNGITAQGLSASSPREANAPLPKPSCDETTPATSDVCTLSICTAPAMS